MGTPDDRAPDQTPDSSPEADDSDVEIKSDDPTASQLFFGEHLDKIADPKLQSGPPEAPEEKLAESASALFFGESLEKAAGQNPDDVLGDDDDPASGGSAE